MSFQGNDLKPLESHLDKIIAEKCGGIQQSIFDSIDFKEMTNKYIKESIDLFKGLLEDYGLLQSDIKRVDFCLQPELGTEVGEDFKKLLVESNMNIDNFYCQYNLNYLDELTKYVSINNCIYLKF